MGNGFDYTYILKSENCRFEISEHYITGWDFVIWVEDLMEILIVRLLELLVDRWNEWFGY